MISRLFRSSRHTTHAIIIVILLLAVGGSMSPASAAVPSVVPGTAVFRLGSDSWPQAHLPQYATVFLGPYRTTDLDYIRSQGSSTRVLMYKNPTYLIDTCANPTPVTCNTAVSYGEALAHDQAYPGDPWILRDSSGNPIKDRNYLHCAYANVGSASYRQRALNNVLASLKAHAGWDGVLFDHSDPGYYNSNGTPIYATASSAAYPTNSSWQTAMKGMLDAIGAPVRSQGFYVSGNASVVNDADGSLTRAWWQSIGPDFDGFMQQYFEMSGANYALKYNDPTTYLGNYNAELGKVDAAQSLGKDFIGGMEYHGETAATMATEMMYGKAAILLKWNGNKSGGFIWQTSGSLDPWNSAWTTDIGSPGGAMYAVGSGWRRDYSGGTVIVNPNKPTGSAITFDLGGSYITPGGQTVTSVTLQPVTAMILTSNGATVISAPGNLTLPTISGTPQQGQTLTANNGTWSNSPTNYSYQWARCDSTGGNCTPISGGTSKTYVLTSADVGATLRITVTAANSGGSTAATSASTPAVTAATTTTTTTTTTSSTTTTTPSTTTTTPSTTTTTPSTTTTTPSTTTTTQAPSSSTYYTLVSKNSAKCLDVTARSLLAGANVEQWSCNGGDNQRWRLVSMGDGSYEVVGKQSGKCLDVTNLSLLDGANVQQWSCNGGKNQRWKLVSTGDGYNELVAQHSSKCLDVANLSLLNGANVQQWTCSGSNNQRWKLAGA